MFCCGDEWCDGGEVVECCADPGCDKTGEVAGENGGIGELGSKEERELHEWACSKEGCKAIQQYVSAHHIPPLVLVIVGPNPLLTQR